MYLGSTTPRWFRDRIDGIVRSVQKTFIKKKSARKQLQKCFCYLSIYFFIFLFSHFVLYYIYLIDLFLVLTACPFSFFVSTAMSPLYLERKRSIVMIEYKYLPGRPPLPPSPRRTIKGSNLGSNPL